MDILGISAFYHDAAAALVRDGAVVAAAQEERFTRVKHDPSFPAHAARWCLQAGGVGLGEVAAVVFYEKPLLKFERLLATYADRAPRGLGQFVEAMPSWLAGKAAPRRTLREALAAVDAGAAPQVPLWFGAHHRSHAASAFFPSPYDHAAVLTVDGVGEWATATLGEGRGNRLRLLREMRWPHSLGLLYSAFTYFLGFRVNSGEYKLMGLAPYGEAGSDRVRRFEEVIRRELAEVREDGSLRLRRDRFDYETGRAMVRDGAWDGLFGFPRRREKDEIQPHHADLALAIQRVTEDAVLRMARTAREMTGARHLCLAGGVALNCVANGVLRDRAGFDGIWVQPAAGDAGGALGAALDAWHTRCGGAREPSAGGADRMRGALLGPAIADDEVRAVAERHRAPNRHVPDGAALCDAVAGLLADGKVVGWVQGPMEWGPRALGNRSILADPRDPAMQRRLNLAIKYREGFRPFAPAVMAERAAGWFEPGDPSPYMLFTAQVRGERMRPGARETAGRPWREQLYTERSDVTAVTHVDGSARLQTVDAATNPRFHALLAAFERRTGCPVLVNTSFNVRGEPIVCTAEDAYRCFLNTEMDVLVAGDRIFHREEQDPEVVRRMRVGAGID